MNNKINDGMALRSTLPSTAAEAAVIARSKQLTEFKWTPLRDVPTYYKKRHTVLPAGVEVKGFPYASEEHNDKFFTENVSFESFLTSIANPHSKIYQYGRAAFDACSYGIVCNGLARYALGIRRRVSTKRWMTIPGMRMVANMGEYKVEDIRLCDVLYVAWEGRSHVALITDILKSADGEIAKIEVSEAVRPSCKREQYDVEVFYDKYKLFALCRYDHLQSVPLLDEEQNKILFESGLEKITPKITVDNGNRSNYLQGDAVLLSIFENTPDTVEIYRNGVLTESVDIAGTSFFARNLGRGYYKAVLKSSGEYVEFCVNRAKVSHIVNGDEIVVEADPCDPNSRILYADFRQAGMGCASLEKYEELTEEEISLGKYSRPIPDGAENFKVYYENAYGIWTHPMTKIR